MPLAYRDPKNQRLIANHLLVAPAGRREAVVTGPTPDAHAALRTLCVDTGSVGDPNPEMGVGRPGTVSSPKHGSYPSATQCR